MFIVAGATVTDLSNTLNDEGVTEDWEVTLTAKGTEDITLTLPSYRPCDEPGAFRDRSTPGLPSRRWLSRAFPTRIPRDEHDGSTASSRPAACAASARATVAS